MKKTLFPLFLLMAVSSFAQPGYEIKLTFKPFKNQYVYLGHYFGKTYPIVDSALLNDKGEAVFRGVKNLPGGIYLVGYPNKSGFFEILIDKQQRFTVIADTATIKQGVKFVNSSDNTLFTNYQQFMAKKGSTLDSIQKKKADANPEEAARLGKEAEKISKEIGDYRHNLVTQNPSSYMAVLLNAMQEPEIPKKITEIDAKVDSTAPYRYFKAHYWDGVNFWDGRLSYTPFLEGKIDKYFSTLVVPHPDSMILEIDKMLGPATASKEMTKFLLIKFVNRYLNQQYMYEDAIMVHLYEKYFAQKDYEWLTPEGRKMITDRAYSLMANIMGTQAAPVDLPDSTGTIRALYEEKKPYTLVVFWDPSCGHCKELLPRLDSMYNAKWKMSGMQIYAIAKETDATRKDWLNFITTHHLNEWTNVYYSKADDKARIDSNIPGYSQLYDVNTFPTLYLLDKDKRIVAKKLSYDQIDEILTLKIKGQ